MVLSYLPLAAWAVLELAVRTWETAQGRGSMARDRGTRILIALSLGAAVALAALLAHVATLPGAHRPLGAVVVVAGLGVRVWAIVTLGRAFRTTVEVDTGQAIITNGPYRWVRHPSYSGLLIILLGAGLTFGSPLSIAVALLLPAPAFALRIRVEEAELTRVLGDPYAAYARSTPRLVPRLPRL